MTNVFGSKRSSSNGALLIWAILMTVFFCYQGGKMLLTSLEKGNEVEKLIAEIKEEEARRITAIEELDAFAEGEKVGLAKGFEQVSTQIVNTLVRCETLSPKLADGQTIKTPEGIDLIGVGAHCNGVVIDNEALIAHQEVIAAQFAEAQAAQEAAAVKTQAEEVEAVVSEEEGEVVQ